MRISDGSSDVCSSDFSGCRANGADITRTNAPQHQGSSRLPAVTRAVIGATREVRPRGGIEFQARLVKLYPLSGTRTKHGVRADTVHGHHRRQVPNLECRRHEGVPHAVAEAISPHA